MSDECWVTVVRAWAQPTPNSSVVVRLIHADARESRDRHFASIDDAVEQIRTWLLELEQASDDRGNDATSE